MSLIEVANGMRNALLEDDAAQATDRIVKTRGLLQAVRGCFLCENCVVECEAGVKVTDVMLQSRRVLQECGLIPRDTWSSVLVDEQWDIFTAYRAIYGIGYADLTRHLAQEGRAGATDCAVAFFPGCSLAAYNPELTRAAFACIERQGGKATMIDECCGSPLKSAGFLDRAAALEQRIVDQVVASGAAEVVAVCPGCANMLAEAFSKRGLEIRVVSMARFLAEHGQQAVRVPGRLRFFKSCQDHDGSYLRDVLALFGESDVVGTICDGCCGAGGAVSSYSPKQQAAKVERVLARCESGDTLVTMCPTCTYTQAFQLASTKRADIVPKHYLELLLDVPFDWQTVFSQLEGMWTGEYGPWLARVFS